MARLGSFDDLLSERTSDQPPHVAEIARALRRIILEDFPEAVEIARLGDKAASYGVGPKKMSESHVYVSPQKGYVNLGFWHGVNLPNPDSLLEGTGKKLRHSKSGRWGPQNRRLSAPWLPLRSPNGVPHWDLSRVAEWLSG